MQTLRVSPGCTRYNVYVGSGVLRDLPAHLRRAGMGTRLALITNPYVFELHGYNLREYLTEQGSKYRFSRYLTARNINHSNRLVLFMSSSVPPSSSAKRRCWRWEE
jgi:glycerol dehydrogenase-like iron-containing ADH family enzyme